MRLWTWQGRGHSLTSGRIDLARSAYHQDEDLPGVARAYVQIAEKLGTDQLVWCYTEQTKWNESIPPRVEWELEVPEAAILAYVDDHAWSKLVGIPTFPMELVRQWCDEAWRATPKDDAAQKAFVQAKIDAFKAPEAEPQLWQRMFLPSAEGFSVTALIRHPVPREWVIAVQTMADPNRPMTPEAHALVRQAVFNTLRDERLTLSVQTYTEKAQRRLAAEGTELTIVPFLREIEECQARGTIEVVEDHDDWKLALIRPTF